MIYINGYLYFYLLLVDENIREIFLMQLFGDSFFDIRIIRHYITIININGCPIIAIYTKDEVCCRWRNFDSFVKHLPCVQLCWEISKPVTATSNNPIGFLPIKRL